MTMEDTKSETAVDRGLGDALDPAEIDVHFQPKVDLRNGRVIGVEALARWQHPERGLLPAAEFIRDLGSGDRMRSLTERVIEISTRAAGDWWRSGLRLQVSVNLPAIAVSSADWNVAEAASRSLSNAGLPGEAIQFEVTEDALLPDPEQVANGLARFAALGGELAIDDFGTGHFSLRQLITLPIDELKIDRSLILGLDDDASRTIIRAVIHLAHQVGLPVVAEGVETKAAWQQLRSMGCERGQGYLISRPLPSREVPAWLASWNQRARELSSTGRIGRRRRRSPKQTPAPAEATA
jgi:EAL domain-containing protein (putative c-di-GMP-specific phosphodiesterase class I)